MLKLIIYLWYKYILREGYEVSMKYRATVGTVMKYSLPKSELVVLWSHKKNYQGYFTHYVKEHTESKETILDEYFVKKLLIHKYGTWH